MIKHSSRQAAVRLATLCSLLMLTMVTQAQSVMQINYGSGVTFNTGIRGQNGHQAHGNRNTTLSLMHSTSMRSVPTNCDGYDWRDIATGDEPNNTITLLQCLREMRDHNTWGIGARLCER